MTRVATKVRTCKMIITKIVARATYNTSNTIICCCLRFHITHSLRTVQNIQLRLPAKFVELLNTVPTLPVLHVQPELGLSRSNILLHKFEFRVSI